jgi:hypothetical protein
LAKAVATHLLEKQTGFTGHCLNIVNCCANWAYHNAASNAMVKIFFCKKDVTLIVVQAEIWTFNNVLN